MTAVDRCSRVVDATELFSSPYGPGSLSLESVLFEVLSRGEGMECLRV
jgi:hypothetical protein